MYLQARHQVSMPGFVLSDGNGNVRPPLPGRGLSTVPAGDFLVHFFEDTVAADADVYVFQSGKHGWQLEWAERIKARGGRVVLDVDDDVRLIPSYNPARLERSQNKDTNRQNAEQVAQLADAITCTTGYLAAAWQPFNAEVHVIPNRLHWPMWQALPPVYERKDWAKVRVGYMGGFDFHAGDMRTIAKELRLWLRRNPDVEFVAAGDHRFHDLIGVPAAQRVSTGKVWFRNLDLPYITSTFDIGLVPLVANKFNEGKSHLKGLEYSACGIVPVASPTAAYRGFIRDGENGFLCSRPSEWTGVLDQLVAEGALRERMGRSAYACAASHTLGEHVTDWETVYAGVIGVGDNADDTRARTAA